MRLEQLQAFLAIAETGSFQQGHENVASPIDNQSANSALRQTWVAAVSPDGSGSKADAGVSASVAKFAMNGAMPQRN